MSIDRKPSRVRPSKAVAIAAVIVLVASSLGCGSTGAAQQSIAEKMVLGDYPAALQVVEEEKSGAFGGKNRLLYWLERGMLLQIEGQYAESNEAFEQAKQIGDELYTKSLTNEGFSILTNDYALDYAGENFERTLIHLFSAINYAELGNQQDALVEIRQVGDYLRKLQVDTTNENVYQDDAFARYLSALFYESDGELDSAFVDYKKAAEVYASYSTNFSVPIPPSLAANAERVAARLGSWAEDDLRNLGMSGPPMVVPPGAGEIIVLHYNGLSPIKSQEKYTIPFAEAWLLVAAVQAAADPDAQADIGRATAIASQIAGVDIVSVAFPIFVDRPYSIATMAPHVQGALEVTPPELVENIGAIAKKDLADRIVRIRTKAIARAAIKYALQKAVQLAAEQAGGDYGSLLSAATQITGNIARYATEQADKRVWSTLPDKIWISTIVVPEGTYDLNIDFLDARQTVIENRVIPAVDVAAGTRRFVIVRTVR
jgi:hypothetical protein